MYTKHDNRGQSGANLRGGVSLAMLLGLLHAGSAQADTVLTFSNNTSPLSSYPSTGTNTGTYTSSFGAGMEYRMISPANTVGGGGEKDVIFGSGNESWTFDDSGIMTAVGGMPQNSGAGNSPVAPVAGTNPALQQSAPFFLGGFTFLAPVQGTLAGNAYGPGQVTVDVVNNTITAIFPVLEAQWGGTYFPLGQLDDGVHGANITFSGTLSNVVTVGPTQTFDFVMTAEHIIQVAEDPGTAGFSLWTGQWELHGTGSTPTVVLNSPSASAGVIGPTVGGPADGNFYNDGRTTLDEMTAAGIPVDTGVDASCVGSCFDFTVTGIGGASVQVVLPLSSPIPASASNGNDPANPIPAPYRKYINGQWQDFDTSTGDTIESGPGSQGDCTGVTYTSGLTEGHFCVRLTISDGGPNDADGAVDGNVRDPGGVGQPTPVSTAAVIPPGESLSGGACTIATAPVGPAERADWWLVGGLLLGLGALRKRATWRQM